MRQRIADALQIGGAMGLTAAAGMVNVGLGLLVGSTLMVVAGVVVTR